MGTDSPIEPQQTFGKYTLIEKLGEGYLGPVYRGLDRENGCPAVIRILCDGIKWDLAIEDLFLQECQSIAGIRHPNIASILDIGREENDYFIAMESLGNRSLASLISQKPEMPVEAKISIMIQVTEGLNHAHKKGILHRNLAPSKIHITQDGTAKIRDFALAYVLQHHLPRPIVRWGTPIYLSPEQIENKNCDGRSDIFSIGTIFYEFLTYLHPFHDPNSNKALDNILLNGELPTFEQFPELPPGIWSLLKTCLAKEPDDRYQSMEDLAEAFRELLASLEEDNRLMLAELYAALAPLRKAAAQPGVSQDTLQLLNAIQKLAKNEIGADYAYLNRLMTDLLEQYPAIQAAADAPGFLNAQSFLEPTEDSFQKPGSPLPTEPPSKDAASLGPLTIDLLKKHDIPAQEDRSPIVPVTRESAPTPSPPLLQESDSAVHPKTKPAHEKKTESKAPVPASRYRRVAVRSYRTVAVLLSILLLALAGYIALGMEAPAAIHKVWHRFMTDSQNSPGALNNLPAPKTGAIAPKKDRSSSQAADARSNPPLIPNELLEPYLENPNEDSGSKKLFARVSSMIDSGMLRSARIELEKLEEIYPGAPELRRLKKQLNSRAARESQEQTQKDTERQKILRRQREEEWNRQASDLFTGGKYDDAQRIVSLWQSEDPGNPQAQEIAVKIGTIQRDFQLYAAAMSENRYQDALSALDRVGKNNPADPSISRLRQQGENRKANARAMLTVLRLGSKGILKLDGRPIGKDGEFENEELPIGRHMLTVQTESGLIASRSQEYFDGQHATMVYDLTKLQLRPMLESDRHLIAQRDLLEQIHNFEAEHSHGALRGNCHGTLSLDDYEIAFKPASGTHGFRMPYKLLKLGRIEEKSIELLFITDNQRFQIFKFRDNRSVERFNQAWSALKTALNPEKS